MTSEDLCGLLLTRGFTQKMLIRHQFKHSSFRSHFWEWQWIQNLFSADHSPWVDNSEMVLYVNIPFVRDPGGSKKCFKARDVISSRERIFWIWKLTLFTKNGVRLWLSYPAVSLWKEEVLLFTSFLKADSSGLSISIEWKSQQILKSLD